MPAHTLFFYIFCGKNEGSRVMIMLETIFAICAAVITVIIAGLLVRMQNKHEAEVKELNEQVKDSLENIAAEVTVLMGEEPSECTLLYLEQRMDHFNQTLYTVQKRAHIRRDRHVKRKKNFAND